MTITRSVEVEVELTPREVAQAFCDMSSDEQSMFFNEVGAMVEADCWNLPMQLECVANDDALGTLGRHVMRLIGCYADPSRSS